MKRQVVGIIQNAFAASKLGTRLSLKIREQCNTVLGLRCKSGIRAEQNGEAWLADRVAPTARTIVDIGANLGDWTTMFASRMTGLGRAILYEPNPGAADQLEQTQWHLSGLEVEIHRKAVGDVVGNGTFFAEQGAGETSSLVENHSVAHARMIDVPLTTLDVEMEALGVKSIDMLKIDAEGYDFRVLLGAEKLLRSQSVGVIQFEYNAPWAAAGSTLTYAFRFLEEMGYTVFLLKAGGLYLLDPRRTGEYFRYSNFVALRPDRLREVLRGAEPSAIL